MIADFYLRNIPTKRNGVISTTTYRPGRLMGCQETEQKRQAVRYME